MVTKITLEKWKDGISRFVVRENGVFKARIKRKDSNFKTKQQAFDYYKIYETFKTIKSKSKGGLSTTKAEAKAKIPIPIFRTDFQLTNMKEKAVYVKSNEKRLTFIDTGNPQDNLKAIDKLYKSKIIVKRPYNQTAQYFVRGVYEDKSAGIYEEISVRGRRVVKGTEIDTPQKAKNDAWKNFLKALSSKVYTQSDEKEGIKYLSDVKNIQEGWVYYTKK